MAFRNLSLMVDAIDEDMMFHADDGLACYAGCPAEDDVLVMYAMEDTLLKGERESRLIDPMALSLGDMVRLGL